MEKRASALGMRLAWPYSEYLILVRKHLLSVQDANTLAKQSLWRELVDNAHLHPTPPSVSN